MLVVQYTVYCTTLQQSTLYITVQRVITCSFSQGVGVEVEGSQSQVREGESFISFFCLMAKNVGDH